MKVLNMEKFPRNNIFNICVNMLRILGESEQNISLKLTCFRTLNCCAMFFILFYVVLNFYHAKSDGYMKTVYSLILLLQGVVKYLGLIYNKRHLIKLCKGVMVLIQKYQRSDEVVYKAVITQNKLLRNIQLSIIALSAFLWLIHVSKPLFVTGYVVVYETAFPNSNALCAIILVFQYYFSCIQGIAVLTTNFAYLLLCAYLILLVQALRNNIKRAINSKCYSAKQEVFECISDHQAFLSAYSLVNNIFSSVLLFEYYSFVIFNCSVIVDFIQNPSKAILLQDSLALLFIWGHFGFFTFFAEQMASEYSHLVTSLYLTSWYSSDLDVQKLILLMMNRSQNTRYFSAGGLVDINVNAFGNVITKIYTVYAFVNNILVN